MNWESQLDADDLAFTLGDARARSENIQMLNRLAKIYESNKTIFINNLESLVLKLIRTKTVAPQLYSIYKNLSHLQSNDSELQHLVLELIANSYLKSQSPEFLIYFAKQSSEIKNRLLHLFINKVVQFNHNEFIQRATQLSQDLSEPVADIIVKYLIQYEYNFNLIFEKLETPLKFEIYSHVMKNNRAFVSKIEEHLHHDKDFRECVSKAVSEGHPIMDSFVEMNPWSWDMYTQFNSIMWENKDKIQPSLKKMIKRSIESTHYNALIFLAQGVNKREIFRIIVSLKDQTLINRFIEKFKNEPEIRLFVPFL